MKSLNLIHTVFAFSPIWLTSLISHVSATGTLAVTSAIETVHEDKRRRAAAVMKIHNDDLLNMPTFTFDDGSDSAVFTKIQATRRVLASGVEEVIWEGTVTKSDEYGFATLLRYDDGPVAASFTTSVAAYELDTTAKGAVQLTSTLWEDVKTGMGVVPSRNESTSSSRFEPAGLVAAGSSYPDLGGTITTSTGAAASLIDSAPQHLRSRELQAGPVVDVLVLITNKAMCRVAGLASGCENSSANRKPVEDKLALAQQQSNSAVQSVGVPLTFRFVRVIVLVPEFDANPDVAALDSMRDSPVVQGWMDEAGADLVALLTGSIPANSPAGIAYINRPESVTSVDFLSTFTFTHELGE